MDDINSKLDAAPSSSPSTPSSRDPSQGLAARSPLFHVGLHRERGSFRWAHRGIDPRLALSSALLTPSHPVHCSVLPVDRLPLTVLERSPFAEPEGRLLLASGSIKGAVRTLDLDHLDGDEDQLAGNPMSSQHRESVEGVAFHSCGQRLSSVGVDRTLKVWDLQTTALTWTHTHDAIVSGVSAHPENPNLVATTDRDGKALTLDTRAGGEKAAVLLHSVSFNGAAFNPTDPDLIALYGSPCGIMLVDTRKPEKILLEYEETAMTGNYLQDGNISAVWNRQGTLLLSLRRMLGPAVFLREDKVPLAEFDAPTYLNLVNYKTGCFAGANGELILSGSDDRHIFAWRVPEDRKERRIRVDRPEFLLPRTHDIVPHVRFSPEYGALLSYGGEESVKVWSGVALTPESEEVSKPLEPLSPYKFPSSAGFDGRHGRYMQNALDKVVKKARRRSLGGRVVDTFEAKLAISKRYLEKRRRRFQRSERLKRE